MRCCAAGLIMCNACGIYLKTHGRNRPVDGASGGLARAGSLKRVRANPEPYLKTHCLPAPPMQPLLAWSWRSAAVQAQPRWVGSGMHARAGVWPGPGMGGFLGAPTRPPSSSSIVADKHAPHERSSRRMISA